MARLMSFALTTRQVENRTKFVTRRLGWKFLEKGDLIQACDKVMGFKKGQSPTRMCMLRIVSVRRERLSEMTKNPAYGKLEASLEGFPEMTGAQFVEMFCSHMKEAKPSMFVTRIEFEYMD